ncbi:MAG TPA: hypothetical protein VM187_17130 [Niastella sp.]|nr:hypothetical protein [Niastella sp.]
MKYLYLTLSVLLFSTICVNGQTANKVVFEPKDSTAGYYLAIPPASGKIKATLVMFSSFYRLEDLLPETRLPAVGYTNDLLVVLASNNLRFTADSTSMDRMSSILQHIAKTYSADTAAFALAAYDIPGNMVMRFTELAYQYPDRFPIKPKVLVGIDCNVDLIGLWRWSERMIEKNFDPDNVGSAKYILEKLTTAYGPLSANQARYAALSPFVTENRAPGNEQYLKQVALRLYYDTDINWHLQNKRNGYYDTNIPDGSELVSRLLRQGHKNAAFIASRRSGIRNNGNRNPTSLSIVDEVECIQWIKQQFGIIDAHTWIPPYRFNLPANWGQERIAFPIDFAPQIAYKGMEELRFAPGWGDPAKEDHWTYGFLWWLEGIHQFNATMMKQYMEAYYSGLVGRNITSRQIPAQKQVPTQANFKSIKPEGETYSGTINMLNYINQQPIKLNCTIHVRYCQAQQRTAVFITVSPQPYAHKVWTELNQLVNTFDCRN